MNIKKIRLVFFCKNHICQSKIKKAGIANHILVTPAFSLHEFMFYDIKIIA